jgi:hypothetical protein
MYLSDVSSCILKTTAVSVLRMLFYQVCSCSVFFTNKYNLLEWRNCTRSQLFLPYSVVLVRKRTILTDRPQPAGEVSAYFS